MRQVQIVIIIILLHALVSCFSKRETIKTDIVGLYKKGYSDFGTDLQLDTNGKFQHKDYHYTDLIMEDQPIGWMTVTYGDFIFENNKIQLTPFVIVRKEVFEQKEVVLDSIPFYESDSTTIKKGFRLVKWNTNIYLLSEEPSFRYGYRMDNDFIEFADNYNSGSEPKWDGQYFAKRQSNKRAETIDKAQIPVKWRDYFLDSVIQVSVVDIEKNFHYDSTFKNSINRYILKGGLELGVKEGMTFYGKDGCCILKIMESDKDSSKGLIELCPYHQDACKVGDILTTWNEKDNGKHVP